MRASYHCNDFDFMPKTYCLPRDTKILQGVWGKEKSTNNKKWIIKPPASARGIGIKVIEKWAQIPKRKKVLVQTYIHRPLLVNDNKFDIRLYVYVTSFLPMRVYLHNEGLVRFASQKYSTKSQSLKNRFVHLTNYSVNKKNANYSKNMLDDDDFIISAKDDCHKWSLKSLWAVLAQKGVDVRNMQRNIQSMVVKTLASVSRTVGSLTSTSCRSRSTVHELYGFDIIIDANFKPWLLEVNVSPSLHSNSPLDKKIKSCVVVDMLNVAGFQLPNDVRQSHKDTCLLLNMDSNRLLAHKLDSSGSLPEDATTVPIPYHHAWEMEVDRSTPTTVEQFPWALSKSEKAKHRYYSRYNLKTVSVDFASILDHLTLDDLKMLVTCMDEWYRATLGDFKRIFPLPEQEDREGLMRFLDYTVGDCPKPLSNRNRCISSIMKNSTTGSFIPHYYDILLREFVSKYHQPNSKNSLIPGISNKAIQLLRNKQVEPCSSSEWYEPLMKKLKRPTTKHF